MRTTVPARVAFFLPNLDIGGVERVMCSLATEFADPDLLVDLVVGNANGAETHGLASTVRVVDLKARRTALATIPLMRYLRGNRPVALLTAKDHTNVVGVLAATLTRPRVPVIVTVHSRPSDALRAPERWTGRVVWHALPRVYRHAGAIVAVSDGVADDLVVLLGRSAAKVRTIANPVISPALLESDAAPPPHPWLEDDRQAPILLWCGRLNPEKAPVAAIEALALVRAQQAAKLVFVGDGPLRADVERRAEDLDVSSAVAITGFVENAAPYLSDADALMLTSEREGLPTVLIEALALGTRVVATDCPSGHREILAGGRYGRLVPVGDARAMADALITALANEPPVVPPDALAQYEVGVAASHYRDLLREIGAL